MLTRAKENKPARRSIYPTEKEALATHTEPFKDLIKESLVSIQSTNRMLRHIANFSQGPRVASSYDSTAHATASRAPRLTMLIGHDGFPCTIVDALSKHYPDMFPEVVLGFRMMALSSMLSESKLGMDKFRDKMLNELNKVNGCWTALFSISTMPEQIQLHQLKVALWLSFAEHGSHAINDKQANHKFAELYKHEIENFVRAFKLRACGYGPNDIVSISKDTLEYVVDEIITHGVCDEYPIEVTVGPAVVLS